jgi:hypothetical protein
MNNNAQRAIKLRPEVFNSYPTPNSPLRIARQRLAIRHVRG